MSDCVKSLFRFCVCPDCGAEGMMNLVDELRARCDYCRPCAGCTFLMLEAADEIERLRAELTGKAGELERLRGQWLSDADLDRIARRMAEVAMEKISETYNASMCANLDYLLGDAAARETGGKDE